MIDTNRIGEIVGRDYETEELRIQKLLSIRVTPIMDDELDTAMALREKAIAERDEARVEALHWRSLYETLLQQVQRRNLQLAKSSQEEGFPEYRFALKNLLPR